MELYHWILAILFSIPAIATKCFNEKEFNRNVYWLKSSRNELILFTLPIILMSSTIRFYKIFDMQYIAYFISIMALFIHSIKRYEQVKAIVEESEIEPKIPEKKKDLTYTDSDKGNSATSDYAAGSGGGGGYGYQIGSTGNYVLYHDNKGYITSLKKYREQEKVYTFAATAFPKFDGFQPGTIYNLDNRPRPVKNYSISLTKEQARRIIISYDNDENPLMRGMVYEINGVKIKHCEVTDQWYLFTPDTEIWTMICFDDRLVKFLQTGEIE